MLMFRAKLILYYLYIGAFTAVAIFLYAWLAVWGLLLLLPFAFLVLIAYPLPRVCESAYWNPFVGWVVILVIILLLGVTILNLIPSYSNAYGNLVGAINSYATIVLLIALVFLALMRILEDFKSAGRLDRESRGNAGRC